MSTIEIILVLLLAFLIIALIRYKIEKNNIIKEEINKTIKTINRNLPNSEVNYEYNHKKNIIIFYLKNEYLNNLYNIGGINLLIKNYKYIELKRIVTKYLYKYNMPVIQINLVKDNIEYKDIYDYRKEENLIVII